MSTTSEPWVPAASSSAREWALTKAPVRTAGAPVAASITRVPFVVERTTVEPGGTFASRISVGELPKSNPATLALPLSPARKSAPAYVRAHSTEATGTTRAPLETRVAMVVLALNASTTTTAAPARAAARAPLSPPAYRAIKCVLPGIRSIICARSADSLARDLAKNDTGGLYHRVAVVDSAMVADYLSPSGLRLRRDVPSPCPYKLANCSRPEAWCF